MAGTAKREKARDTVNGVHVTDHYMTVANKIGKMSGPDFRASLLRAGIISTKGTLRSKYKKK
jgi:hypothetical protein